MTEYFWDIESYDNLFLCGFLSDEYRLEMYYLVTSAEDEAELLKIKHAEKRFPVKCVNLAKDAHQFAKHFEKRIPRKSDTLIDDFLGRAATEIKPRTDWYIGFNTFSYDIPMIDEILKSITANKVRMTPAAIRRLSNHIIHNRSGFVANSYLQYANQVDRAMLNETRYDKMNHRPEMGLKTLVGILRGSIIESESNKSRHSNDILSDVQYNINDIVEFKDVVFPGTLDTNMDVKQSLLEDYPHLRDMGLTANDTAAKFVAGIVAPDKPIEDTPVVDFTYPTAKMATKLGIQRIDVLDDTLRWYKENIQARIEKHNPQAAAINYFQFLSIYNFYNEIRGNNWNESGRHFRKTGIISKTREDRKALMKKYATYLPLLNEYGEETGSYVNFSIGGIHGAEYNLKQLEQDRAKIGELREKYKYISKIPKKAIGQQLRNLVIAQSRTSVNGAPIRFSHEIGAYWEASEPTDEILPPEEFTPFMYDSKDEKEIFHQRYHYTSSGNAMHQDFTSYYPLLIMNMGVFDNGSGVDPYEEIYQKRVALKTHLKSLKWGSAAYILADIKQLGYKLVLNSASGILDGSDKSDTNLRANNKGMQVRCTGQLFTFMIGAKLAINGARIPSSNTDGVYEFDIDAEKNLEIITPELQRLGIGIEPEPCGFVSKDSNNRMETADGEVESARGGMLTSWAGATVTTQLTHPAVLDKLMTMYLQNDNILDGPVRRDLIEKAITDYQANPAIIDRFEDYPDADKRTIVYMTSWVLRQTAGSIFIDENGDIKDGTERGWLSTTGTKFRRFGVRKAKPSKSLDEVSQILTANDQMGKLETVQFIKEMNAQKYFQEAISVDDYRHLEDRKTSVPIVQESKISGMPKDARLYVNNASLLTMNEDQVDEIYQQINWDLYADMAEEAARKWHNKLVAS